MSALSSLIKRGKLKGFSLPLREKAIVVLFGITILPLLFNQYQAYVSQDRVMLQLEQENADKLARSVTNSLKGEGRMAILGAVIIAENKLATELFAQGKRDELTKLYKPTFDRLKQELNVAQFQYHLPPATSFLRLHQINKFGDDLSSFRQTVLETNAAQKNIVGLEKGKGGYGIRGISPVVYNGKHIGSVELGMNFDLKWLQNLQKEYGGEWILENRLKGISWEEIQFTSTVKDNLYPLTEAENAKLDRGQVLVKFDRALGNKITSFPINDYRGEVVSYLKNIVKSDYFRNKSLLLRSMFLSFFLIGIVIVCLVLLIAKKIIAPIHNINGELTGCAENLTNASQNLTTTSSTLQEISQSYQELIGQISTTMENSSQGLNTAAANSEKAAQLSRQARSFEEQSAKLMADVVQSMGGIRQSNEKISQIVALIRDISFQTNMLALNAAVEAARAGDAGLGFSVVADEVRSLSQKTSSALKEIEEMIATSRSSTNRGVTLVQYLSKEFGEIQSLTLNVDQTISAIAANMQEQQGNISLIQTSARQIEESTTVLSDISQTVNLASSELTEKAEIMFDAVGRLDKIVNG